MTPHIKTSEAWTLITHRQAFTTNGALSGRAYNPPTPGSQFWGGHLPQGWRDKLRRQNVDYVVFSYATPIAWHKTRGGWEFPHIHYSPTTSRHQSQVRQAGIKETLL